MDNLEKTKRIGGIVFYAIWLVIALALWFGGMGMFLERMNGDDAFTSWIIWGAMCIFPIIIPIIKMIAGSTKDGARQGANEYSASVAGNSVYVENHPFRGAIIGLAVGIFGGLLVGPIMLAFYVIKNLAKMIKMIVDFVKAVKGV